MRTRRCTTALASSAVVLISLLLLAGADLTLAAAADAPATAPSLDLFLLVGQSNMAGRGKVEPQDQVPDVRILMLNKSNEWVPAIDPIHFDKPKVAGVGPAHGFAVAVAAAVPNRSIGLVPCAVGGTSINQWKKGEKLYEDAIRRAKVAMQRGTFKAILWHQGESDLGDKKQEGYPEKLKQLIADFRADLGNADLPFIVGQLGEFHQKAAPDTDAFNAQLKEFAAAEPRCACATSEGLTSIGDNTHFDAKSQREFGRRYAAAYLKIIGQPAGR
jgi:hypothetical protein